MRPIKAAPLPRTGSADGLGYGRSGKTTGYACDPFGKLIRTANPIDNGVSAP
jgi:hypothetical protein